MRQLSKFLILFGLLLPAFAFAQTVLPGSRGGTGYATTTGGNVGNCLAVAANNPISYSFTGCSGGGGGGSAYPFGGAGNSTSTLTQFNGGITAYASSTVGNGTATGGLTINGTATTTTLCLTGDSCRTTWPSSTGGAFPFTPFTNYNGTTTALGLQNGFFSTASSTFNANLFLTNLSQGALFNGTNGLTSSVATSSIGLSSSFGYTGTLGAFIGGANGTLSIATHGVLYSMLPSVNANSLVGNPTNVTANAQTLGVTYPLAFDGAGLIFNGLATSSPFSVDQFLYTNHSGSLITAASSSLNLPNSALTNSSIIINGTTFNLGDSKTITAASSTLLTDFNKYTNLQTFSGGASSTGEISVVTASTTNLTVSAVRSALHLGDANGNVSAYGGASACSSNNFVTALSSIGGTTCGSSTISGVALGGTLAALTATNATLTFSGSYDGTTARTVGLNLANANTWSVFQQFGGNASTTQLSAYLAYFGQTSTSTFSGNGSLTLPTAALLTAPFASSTAITVSGSLYVPASTSQTPTVIGQTAIDTTTDTFRYFGTATRNLVPFYTMVVSVASSTWGAGSTTISLAPPMANITVVSAYCEAIGGTLGVSLWNGTTRANYIATASSTINLFTYSSNNTFSAGTSIRVDIGTAASSPTSLGCRFKYTYDTD